MILSLLLLVALEIMALFLIEKRNVIEANDPEMKATERGRPRRS